jgi:leader peptidase (prepilin peptidase)/N-methyltransferase
METFFYLCLFIFWTLFWSFSSVLIYRLKSWESWIMNWRSHCPKCNNILHSLELIPIFSWIKNLWKCKYCKEKVSAIYPSLEISTWILFTLIWYFLIDFNLIVSLNWFEIFKLIFWLSIWFISIIYIFYDILFLEIHEWVLLTWI